MRAALRIPRRRYGPCSAGPGVGPANVADRIVQCVVNIGVGPLSGHAGFCRVPGGARRCGALSCSTMATGLLAYYLKREPLGRRMLGGALALVGAVAILGVLYERDGIPAPL